MQWDAIQSFKMTVTELEMDLHQSRIGFYHNRRFGSESLLTSLASRMTNYTCFIIADRRAGAGWVIIDLNFTLA